MACDTIIDSYGTANRDGIMSMDTIDRFIGQAFTMGGTGRDICKAQFYLNLHDLNSGEYYTVESRIYACSGTVGSNGVPTGTALATSNSVTITQGDTGWNSWIVYDFTFSTPYTLSASTDYCVLCYVTVANISHIVDDIEMGYNVSGSHSGNLCFNHNGSVGSSSTGDAIFYMYYDAGGGGGWTGTVNGITNPTKINGVAATNISKVNGVS